MNITAMCFSPNGNTKKIICTIAKSINKNFNIIDFTLPQIRNSDYNFSNNDLVVIGVPVYAGRVPNVLLKFLDKIKGENTLCVPVVVYGNRNYDDALIELKTILENNGFCAIVGGAFVAQHAFSKILAKNRPDSDDLAKACDFGKQIADKVNTSHEFKSVKVNGFTPVREYYKPRDRAGNFINILKVKPKTKTELCNNCGICVNACPMGSISRENPSEITGICIKCCACEKKCPTGAKYFDDEGYLYHKTELELEYTRRAEPEIFI